MNTTVHTEHERRVARMRELGARGNASPRQKWFYFGDVNIEYGGYFYNLDNWKWDYVDVWRVTPCSDGGGPDNEFWIEQLVVNIPRRAKAWEAVTRVAPECVDAYRDATPPKRRHILIDALITYGTYDQEHSTHVRVGRMPDVYSRHAQWDATEPERILNGNTDLRRYVLKCAKAGNIV